MLNSDVKYRLALAMAIFDGLIAMEIIPWK